jgi:hypothetical protein
MDGWPAATIVIIAAAKGIAVIPAIRRFMIRRRRSAAQRRQRFDRIFSLFYDAAPNSPRHSAPFTSK